MAKLVVTLKGKVIDQHFIDKPEITVGREAGNDILIDDPEASRMHARIVSVGDDEIVEDLASSNGTRVNGRPVVRQILQHRDVIEIGSHQLRYMSSRIASDTDFERTLLIQTLPRQAGSVGFGPIAGIPAARSATTRFAEGSVVVVAGSDKHAGGDTVRLDRVVTTFGVPGEQLVVLTRRPQGIFLTHVEGRRFPRVNGKPIGDAPQALKDGDLIEAAGCRLKFKLETTADQP